MSTPPSVREAVVQCRWHLQEYMKDVDGVYYARFRDGSQEGVKVKPIDFCFHCGLWEGEGIPQCQCQYDWVLARLPYGLNPHVWDRRRMR